MENVQFILYGWNLGPAWCSVACFLCNLKFRRRTGMGLSELADSLNDSLREKEGAKIAVRFKSWGPNSSIYGGRGFASPRPANFS